MKKIQRLKNIILPILLFAIMLSAIPSTVSAKSINKQISTETIYFEDGSYAVITTEVLQPAASSISTYAATSTKTASRTLNYCNASNEVLWYIKVIGTYTYGNGSATCTKADVEAKSCNKYWTMSGASAARGGATAYASATAQRYYLGNLTNTVKKTVSLTCSPTGTLS